MKTASQAETEFTAQVYATFRRLLPTGPNTVHIVDPLRCEGFRAADPPITLSRLSRKVKETS
jgi:hypothetical protein